MAKDNKTISLQEVMKIMTDDIKNGSETIVSDSLKEQKNNEEKQILEKLKKDENFKTEFKFACKFLYANLLKLENEINTYIDAELNLNDREVNLMKYAMEILKTYAMDYYFYIYDDLNEEPYNEPIVKEIINVYMEATKEADEEIDSMDQDPIEEEDEEFLNYMLDKINNEEDEEIDSIDKEEGENGKA